MYLSLTYLFLHRRGHNYEHPRAHSDPTFVPPPLRFFPPPIQSVKFLAELEYPSQLEIEMKASMEHTMSHCIGQHLSGIT